jgi:hypothetical protein
MKFLFLISLLSLLSLIFSFQAKSQSFLKEAQDDLDMSDNLNSEYDGLSNNELVKEDNYDNNHDNENIQNFSINETGFNQKALEDEIHKDIGSEKVSYKFDD